MRYGFRKFEEKKLFQGHLKLGGENPKGERIDANSICFTRGGKPWIPVMAEYHFSRDHRENWYRELCKMKAGGITVVSTYLFWIYHEEIEGEMDFTGDRDIRAFVKDCARAGLEVVIRIGPWAHGECRNGGFPDWLLAKQIPLRENHPAYLAEVKRWYRAVEEQVRGLFFKDGGNIVGIQLENEYVHNADHLAELKRIAIECGLIAPIYTVTGWNSAYGARIPVDEVIPVFGGYCEAPWENHTDKLPPSNQYFFNFEPNDSAIGADLLAETGTSGDGWRLPYERYPFATCELGGGIQVTHHRRPIIRPMDVYTISLVKLGCGNNLPGYYMYHGGVNPIGKHATFQESRATHYPNDYSMLSYDFQTALSEYGEVRRQYGLLNMLHLFLADFGEDFALLSAVAPDTELTGREDKKTLRYAMRSDGRHGYVFVNHYQRLDRLEDIYGAEITTGCGAGDDQASVTFPPVDICGEICFFFPYNFTLGKETLRYATAQPLCRDGDTCFFVEIPGIAARYCGRDGREYVVGQAGMDSGFCTDHGLRIVTLTMDQAACLRRLDDRLVIGESCNLYLYDGKLSCAEGGDYTWYEWDGERFLRHRQQENQDDACNDSGRTVPHTEEVLSSAPESISFGGDLHFEAELQLEGERELTWKRIGVSATKGFIEIDGPYDVAQIYADGAFVADNFYYGLPWRVPARLLAGKECFLVMSRMRDDFYKEF